MSNTVSGIGAGASAGGQMGGGWGALFGGIFGGLFGSKADEAVRAAKKLVKRSNALRTDATMLRSYAEQRTLLRQANLVRMTSLSNSSASGAELDSSGAQGIQASIRTQSYDNFLIGESILNEQLDANQYEAKAAKMLEKSQELMSLFGGGIQLAQLIPQYAGTDQKVNTYGADSSSPTAPSLQNAFDTNLVNPGGIQTVSGNPYNA